MALSKTKQIQDEGGNYFMARSKKIAGGIQFTWSEEKNAPTLREVIDAAGKEFGDISPENLKIKVEYGPHNVPTFLQILKK